MYCMHSRLTDFAFVTLHIALEVHATVKMLKYLSVLQLCLCLSDWSGFRSYQHDSGLVREEEALVL